MQRARHVQAVEEGQFRHPVSGRVITGVRMPTGVIFQRNYFYRGDKDWIPCPPQLADGKSKLGTLNTFWVMPSPESAEKNKKYRID